MLVFLPCFVGGGRREDWGENSSVRQSLSVVKSLSALSSSSPSFFASAKPIVVSNIKERMESPKNRRLPRIFASFLLNCKLPLRRDLLGGRLGRIAIPFSFFLFKYWISSFAFVLLAFRPYSRPSSNPISLDLCVYARSWNFVAALSLKKSSRIFFHTSAVSRFASHRVWGWFWNSVSLLLLSPSQMIAVQYSLQQLCDKISWNEMENPLSIYLVPSLVNVFPIPILPHIART